MRGLTGTGEDRPETTPLQLGRPVKCSDGSVGHLAGVVIDPRERHVSHIVVEDPNGAARLVPAELLVPGWAPSSDVVLSCSVADVVNRPTIRSFSYVGLDEFPQSDERSDIGVEDMEAVPSFGTTEFGDFGADLWTGYAVTYDRIPPGSAELRRASVAVSADDEELGTVDGFLIAGARLTHVVVEHKELLAIPIDSVAAIQTDRISVRDAGNALAQVDSRWLPLA